MRILYNFFFILLALIYLPYFIFARRYRYGLFNRFGIVSKQLKLLAKKRNLIWIHAVSVGEMRAAGILAPLLRREFPGYTLLFSSITHTGNKIARTIATPGEFSFYLPFDLSFITDRIVNRISPKLFISLESEFWPNLIYSLNKIGVPIILVNGRISKRSYLGYKRFRFLLKPLLKRFSFFCMQSERDMERIIDLGVQKERVECTGNLKFDLPFLGVDAERYRATFRSRLRLNEGDIFFVCGSTHRGEEQLILKAFKKLTKDWKNLRLLIAPRHIERAEEVAKLVKRFELEPIRTSLVTGYPSLSLASAPSAKASSASARGGTGWSVVTDKIVFILDTMGELQSIYSVSDIVFVGGSLVKRGGHNPIEPAIYSRPIIFGRWMFNFQDIANNFIENNAAISVDNEQELSLKIEFLLRHPEARKALGLNAKEAVKKNSGSTERTVVCIKKILI